MHEYYLKVEQGNYKYQSPIRGSIEVPRSQAYRTDCINPPIRGSIDNKQEQLVRKIIVSIPL